MNYSLETKRAELLALAAGLYSRKDVLDFDPEWRGAEIRKLHAYGLLSLSAMAEIVGTTVYRVEQAIHTLPRPEQRGKLNPAHLSLLAYSIRFGRVNKEWLESMLEEGTSLSTIVELTGISRSTLSRLRR